MYPTLITFGNISFYSYGTSLILGFLLSSFLFYWMTKKYDLNHKIISNRILIIFLSTLIAGRLLHILLQYQHYSKNMLSIINIMDGGISMWGAILGGYLSIRLVIRKDRKNISKWMDVFSIVFLFLSSLIYLGQFGQGVGIGKTTDFFMGIIIDNINSPYVNVPVHPTSLYMAILCFLFFLLSLFLFTYKKYPYLGFIYELSLIFFSLSNLITESLRWDVSYWMYNYSIDKTISTLVAIIFSIKLIYSTWKIYGFRFKKKN